MKKPRRVARVRDIPAAEWDALFPAVYPFTQHAFLAALEEHGCIGGSTGWQPCHLVLDDGAGRPLAAMPLYRKRHSYGEFVFDFAWARAAQQLGLAYYPKLLCAIPFTPVAGPRFGARSADDRTALLDALEETWAAEGLSSVHALFLNNGEAELLRERGWLERWGLQFQWYNRGYRGFDEFLSRLSHDKRKKILRERRRVAEAGLRFEHRRGDELSESEWAQVYSMYGNTYEERGQTPYLTLPFFLDYGRRAGTPLRLILAYEGADAVAVAITLVAGDTLYGRHWGCSERYHSLHFETCYYQGIELCLRENLARFDAGAQGEHKRARGFEPVITRSAHRMADPQLRVAVGAYLERERAEIGQAQRELAQHSAYRSS